MEYLGKFDHLTKGSDLEGMANVGRWKEERRLLFSSLLPLRNALSCSEPSGRWPLETCLACSESTQ